MMMFSFREYDDGTYSLVQILYKSYNHQALPYSHIMYIPLTM